MDMKANRNQTKRLIGARLKELRQQRDFSQEALSERVGVSPQYLSGIERGRENPTMDTLVNISDGLGVEIGELFNVYHHEATTKELKGYIAGLMREADEQKLRTMAKFLRSLLR